MRIFPDIGAEVSDLQMPKMWSNGADGKKGRVMPYEEDYKMWLEKMLIESNPDWVCDGMYDKEITRNWCVDYCGKDDEYITPKCLHMYYHHIARADRKTEQTEREGE